MVAILAGGQSRRMGQDKASVIIDGVPLLERTARIARAVSASVAVVGRAQPGQWDLPDVVFMDDEAPGDGPLGGLRTALRHSGGHAVLLLACDLPALTAEALSWLIWTAQEHQPPLVDGLVTVNGGQREPLFAVYTTHCLPLVEAHRAAGRRSLQSLLDAGQFAHAELPRPLVPALVNINTPAELAAWHQSGERRP